MHMMQDDNVATKKMLMGIDPSENLPPQSLDLSQRDLDAMRRGALDY